MLIPIGNTEEVEDDDEDEDVINRQGFLDYVSGEKF